jgi:hypothetical protein
LIPPISVPVPTPTPTPTRVPIPLPTSPQAQPLQASKHLDLAHHPSPTPCP